MKAIKKNFIYLSLITIVLFLYSCKEKGNGVESDNPTVEANFDADNQSITAGDSVTFGDLSHGNPTAWNWTFVGGTPSTSTDQNPVVAYEAPGEYEVTLAVTGDSETSVKKRDDFISANSEDTFTYIFKDNFFGYGFYRIPAIVKTTNGVLLAFAEGRDVRSDGDSGDIDLVLRRSEDGGDTWGDLIVVWNDEDNTCGNPVPIVDAETGRIHLLMTWNDGRDEWGPIVKGEGYNTRRPYYSYSDDDGKTWTTPRELTDAVKKSSWGWYGTGPGHGIKIKKGEHKGRLVSPNYYSILENGNQRRYAHVIYSDDNGMTWKTGASTPDAGVGESIVVELPNGKLMLNMRPREGNYRYYTISSDGGETWEDMEKDTELLDPQSQGSIISAVSNLFFSNAKNTERIDMTVQMSLDSGNSWPKEYHVYDGPSGYSDLVMISDNKLGLLYERGVKRYSEGIAFEVININQLK